MLFIRQFIFKKISSFVKKTFAFITDLLFPIECLGCNKYGVWVCRKCFAKIEFIAAQSCPVCHAKTRYGEFCPACRNKYYLNGILVAGDYNNELLSKLIKQMKYRFTREIAPILGDFLVLFLRNFINQKNLLSADIINGSVWRAFAELKNAPLILDRKTTLLVPVPLHKKRLRWRGYNQAEEIAKTIASKLNYRLDTAILIRKKYNQPQARLSHANRSGNIRDCFACQKQNLAQTNILLIDDVATSASTLNECAKVLKQKGAQEVWGLVVAKG